MIWRCIIHFASMLLFAIFLILQTTAQEVTIGRDRELQAQRNCVRYCLTESGGNNIWARVGCADSDSCLCKDNIRPFVSSYLESCIQTHYKTCTDGQDYAIGVSIYDRYCNFAGPPTVSATPTAGPVPRPQVTATITLFTSTPTVTVLSSSARGMRLSLDTANNITVGLMLALSTIGYQVWI